MRSEYRERQHIDLSDFQIGAKRAFEMLVFYEFVPFTRFISSLSLSITLVHFLLRHFIYFILFKVEALMMAS